MGLTPGSRFGSWEIIGAPGQGRHPVRLTWVDRQGKPRHVTAIPADQLLSRPGEIADR